MSLDEFNGETVVGGFDVNDIEPTKFNDSKIKTSKEERLLTGLDLTGKKIYTSQGKIYDVFIKAYGIIMDYGANKYEYANFEKAPYKYSDVLNCLLRHLSAYEKGELIDPESEHLHLGHIIARAAIAVMKASRQTVDTNPDALRFIGWESEDIEAILSIIPDLFNKKMYSELAPKKIPFTAHVTIEMIDAIAESPFFVIRDKYSLEGWVKTLQLSLVSFLISHINGETPEDEILHGKVMLWLAINVFYHESKLKKNSHPDYYQD